MSDPRTKITAYFNIEECGYRVPRFSSPAAWSQPPPMPIFRGTQLLLCAYLRLADPNSKFIPPTGALWYFGIDDAYTADKADLVNSTNDQFNIPGDWAGLDVATGQISVRVDLTAEGFKTSLGSASSKTMYAAIFMQPLGGKWTPIAHWDILVKNIAIDPTSVTQTVPMQYASLDYVDAAISNLSAPVGGSYRFRKGLFERYNPTTNLWHASYPDGAEGQVHEVFGEGVE